MLKRKIFIVKNYCSMRFINNDSNEKSMINGKYH
jgi:hypothetical protein